MKQMSTKWLLLWGFLLALGCGDDGDATAQAEENTEALCSDGVDNDGDGATDCADLDCQSFEFCMTPDPEWRTTWVASQQLTESLNNPPDPPGLAGNTLRQMLQITVGGEALRITFSNEYGREPLTIVSAAVAKAKGRGGIVADTHRPLTFSDEPSVTVAPGERVTSDPVDWELAPFTDVTVSMLFDDAPPEQITGHPGSRTSSFIGEGDTVADADMSRARATPRWYFISSADVLTAPEVEAIVVVGDSITDGYGSTTDKNNRWPNELARRLAENPETDHIAVLNQGVGGNCATTRCGNGVFAVTRFSRDVLGPLGVEWVILFEGINDLYYRVTAERLISAFTEMAEEGKDEGLTVIGATIMPCEGHYYYDEDLEENRQAFNGWVRDNEGQLFDHIIDFDEIARDPDQPTRLREEVDGGDGLHPSVEGYAIMAEAIDLSIFQAE